ncbi:MAG: DUF1508 domain-containing protein [unclassified Hahellaceae]|nr:DUF1508 domain-containing protein [Hahellaceae bacterium]
MRPEYVWSFNQDLRGEWRWNCKAPNGRILGASSEGYHNKSDCLCNAQIFGYVPESGNGSGILGGLLQL